MVTENLDGNYIPDPSFVPGYDFAVQIFPKIILTGAITYLGIRAYKQIKYLKSMKKYSDE